MFSTLIITALLFYVMQRWPRFGVALKVTVFVFACIGLIILTKVGYTFEFLKLAFAIPIDFVVGFFGLLYHALFG